MNCHACSRRTLGLFIRSFVPIANTAIPRFTTLRSTQPSRFFSAAARLQVAVKESAEPPKPFATNKPQNSEEPVEHEKPAWQIQKEAIKEKLGGAAWNPRKKLSPDTMEGIRHLHKTHPEKFTTAVLSQHFQVSPEAIRRILKSKWRPSDEEADQRLRRWDKRGEKIWSNLVELGIKPPKKWREMGVGRARNGQKPRWKTGTRNTVPVHDNFGGEAVYDGFSEDILPIVDASGSRKRARGEDLPLTERLGA